LPTREPKGDLSHKDHYNGRLAHYSLTRDLVSLWLVSYLEVANPGPKLQIGMTASAPVGDLLLKGT